ncbi:MAG: hypothetical protein AAFQ79_12910 [Pseudomonadota bacterium]
MTTYHSNGMDETAGDDTMGATLKARAEEQMDAIKEASAVAQKRTEEAVTNTVNEGARFVRENPGVALAGAVGVGVLIGLALRGRD